VVIHGINENGKRVSILSSTRERNTYVKNSNDSNVIEIGKKYIFKLKQTRTIQLCNGTKDLISFRGTYLYENICVLKPSELLFEALNMYKFKIYY
jgi:hypothetical protein